MISFLAFPLTPTPRSHARHSSPQGAPRTRPTVPKGPGEASAKGGADSWTGRQIGMMDC